MMTRERIKVGIQIAARVAELHRLAERTARDYEEDSACAEYCSLSRCPPRSQGRALVRSFAEGPGIAEEYLAQKRKKP